MHFVVPHRVSRTVSTSTTLKKLHSGMHIPLVLAQGASHFPSLGHWWYYDFELIRSVVTSGRHQRKRNGLDRKGTAKHGSRPDLENGELPLVLIDPRGLVVDPRSAGTTLFTFFDECMHIHARACIGRVRHAQRTPQVICSIKRHHSTNSKWP